MWAMKFAITMNLIAVVLLILKLILQGRASRANPPPGDAEARDETRHEDDLRATLESDSAEIADLKRQLAEAQVSAVQPCGHHMSLRIKSVESDYEFCELCEARHMQRDAETAESNYRAQRDDLRVRVETLEAALEWINDQRYGLLAGLQAQRRQRNTVHEDNAWPMFQKVNRQLVEIFDKARAALSGKE